MISLTAKERVAFSVNQLPSAHSHGPKHDNSFTRMNGELSRRHLYFFLFVLGSCFAFWSPLRNLIQFSLARDYASHILVVAPISAYLIYVRRHQVFSKVQFNFFAGSSLFLAGLILVWIGNIQSHIVNGSLSVEILGLVILWIAGFILFYGTTAYSAAQFPLLFLLLQVPIPDFLIDKAVFLLQAGSAAVAYSLFRLLNVPVFEQGFILRLPTLTIEVAKECSGIRSSIVLLITILLVAQFVLHSAWRKSLMVLSIIPIVVFKNGVRIVTISMLTMYVSRRFLHGWLHTSGGIVFYLLGLLALFPILVLLKRGESRDRLSVSSQAEGSISEARSEDRRIAAISSAKRN